MTQNERIRNYLLSGRALTKSVALRQFRAWRLGARIFDLRSEGMPIVTTRNTFGDIAYRYVGSKMKRKVKHRKSR